MPGFFSHFVAIVVLLGDSWLARLVAVWVALLLSVVVLWVVSAVFAYLMLGNLDVLAARPEVRIFDVLLRVLEIEPNCVASL